MSKSSDWALREEEKRNDDDGYDAYLNEIEIAKAEAEFEALEKARVLAEEYILMNYTFSTFKSKEFFQAIWHASTEILPSLEVQVVIDGENNCYVTTGSSGYVEFGMKPPVGMKLPIKCWIHTHPFGSAYFSGTDISTVSIWERRMEEAFVLGGSEFSHYGYWKQGEPKQLEIYRNGELERMQYWGVKNEEE